MKLGDGEYTRPEGVWIFAVGQPPRALPIAGDARDHLDVPVGDVEMISYGVRSFMWIVRSAQGRAPVNRVATDALRINGVHRTICGPVVVKHEAATFLRR